jgi:sulfatase modifying factor 1
MISLKRIIAVVLWLLAYSACDAAITIETVPIGDIGNPSDPASARGAVNNAYNIGKYEVTVGQYTEFLNAVAATDTYALYNTRMASDLNIAGIAQSGISGSYSYSLIGSPNHPISYVSWGDAARFVNWLQNGQPTGPQTAATTEDGTYALNGATSNLELSTVARKVDAKWFLPTESEWYKAAYYQPAAQGGDVDGYWAYPMRTNDEPYSDQPPGATPDNTRVGNFVSFGGPAGQYNDGFAQTDSTTTDPAQNYLTDVGAYLFSPSFYGTFDQDGNVQEWNETPINGVSFQGHGARGGDWSRVLNPASVITGWESRAEINFLGFRVASAVPEPSAMLRVLVATVCFNFRKPRFVADPHVIR